MTAQIYTRRNGGYGSSCDGCRDTGHHIVLVETKPVELFKVYSVHDTDLVIAALATRAAAEQAIESDWREESSSLPVFQNIDKRAALLRIAFDEEREAQAHLEQTLHRLFPPGSSVEWERGEFIQSGAVVRHDYGTDLTVMNMRSGKSVKITAGDILRAAARRRKEQRRATAHAPAAPSHP